LLIVGCGDVLQRALPWLLQRFRIYATARSDATAAQLRARGVTPIAADLDNRRSLLRLGRLGAWVIHSAPPAPSGRLDQRTRRLTTGLTRQSSILSHPPSTARRARPQPSLPAVYIGTTGVYGNREGQWTRETTPLAARNDRAQRRADAELTLRTWARRQHRKLALLRAPGIYAIDRLPTARLVRQEPCIANNEDSYSNHIHADDLARAVCMALYRGRPLRTYNVCDDRPLKMGDWFDLVADHAQLARPPRVTRAIAQQVLSPGLLSYLNESRRIENTRLKQELRLRLHWPAPEKLLTGTHSGEPAAD